jgi:molybdopterin-guanine dinucleotide biosynthesis protein A
MRHFYKHLLRWGYPQKRLIPIIATFENIRRVADFRGKTVSDTFAPLGIPLSGIMRCLRSFDTKIAPCSIILIWDFIGAYAMPHISRNALNISRASSGILCETPCTPW